jgi:hypothetical protein
MTQTRILKQSAHEMSWEQMGYMLQLAGSISPERYAETLAFIENYHTNGEAEKYITKLEEEYDPELVA